MADAEAKRWWRVWGAVQHREDDPGFAITLQTANGRPEPGMRALRHVPPDEIFSVNFHHVPKELLEKCPSFANIAFARLSGESLSATAAAAMEGLGVRCFVDGKEVRHEYVEKK